MLQAAPSQHPTAITKAKGSESAWWVDLVLFGFLAALAVGFFDFGVELIKPAEPLQGRALDIDLSLKALPLYTLFSLGRGFAAYFISLVFSLIYGAVAAKFQRAERVMIPILDILQGIPVLGFLPGLVLGMVALFPHSNLGLELACIIMIFTGQAWNMAFAFYGSVHTVPTEMREVAQLYHLGWWKTFRTLELPFGTIPLVWNSMMSMAGGWFVLNVSETFRLGDRDFRLPGIGSYMSAANDKGDAAAQFYAIVAMAVMIIAIDQLLWRPLVAWSNRFKFDDTAGEAHSSWVLDFLRRSKLLARLGDWVQELRQKSAEKRLPVGMITPNSIAAVRRQYVTRGLSLLVLACSVVIIGAGLWKMFLLISTVTAAQWGELAQALVYTFLRVVGCLVIGAIWAVPAGIIIGRSPRLSKICQPVVQLAASFPAPMLFPVVTGVMLLAGINFSYGCVILMLLGSQWYILFNVIAGAKAIPTDLTEAADVYGVSRFRRWRELLLPAVFAPLITGLVTAAGGAWNASIIAELVVYKGKTLVAPGLGSLIFQATQDGNFGLLCAGVIILSVALVIFNRAFWKRLYRLADRRFALNR